MLCRYTINFASPFQSGCWTAIRALIILLLFIDNVNVTFIIDPHRFNAL